MYQGFIDIQVINHEKPTLEVRQVTKLHQRDSASSNNDFTSYAQSMKQSPDLYPEGAMLSKFIYEGRPTTTEPTFVALPYLTSHSTFHECSRGTPCQPQASPHRHLTKQVVISSYCIRLERRNTLLLTFITHWKNHNRINKEEVDLLKLKEFYNLPSWYPLFQLPYQIDVKVTCKGFYIYIEIIYIDSSPDPDIFAPYVYSQPSDEII